MSRQRIESLKRRLEGLEQQIVIAEQELLAIDDDVSYSRKEKQIELLYQRIDDIVEKISGEEAKNSSFEGREKPASVLTSQSKIFNKRLRYLDRKRARKYFQDICRKFDSQGGGALFLLNEAYKRQGKLLIDEMCDALSESGGDWRTYEVGFAPGDILDIQTLSQRLCQSFQQQNCSMEELVELICDSIQISTTLFFEIQDLDISPSSSELLDWFIRDFWMPLLVKRNQVCQVKKYDNVRFFATITCSGNGRSFLRTPYCGKPKTFNPLNLNAEGSILHLPLETWKESDIRTWLTQNPPPEYSRNSRALEDCARTIHQKGGGIPIAIVHLLQNLYLNTPSCSNE